MESQPDKIRDWDIEPEIEGGDIISTLILQNGQMRKELDELRAQQEAQDKTIRVLKQKDNFFSWLTKALD